MLMKMITEGDIFNDKDFEELIESEEGPKGKNLRDACFDYINISELERSLLDTPWLQRLRNIKQLGTTNRTYISAHNTRFEHSLGVLNITSKILDQLDRNGSLGKIIEKGRNNDLESKYDSIIFRDMDMDSAKKLLKQYVRLIALLHDIGHGPYSHVSERFLLPNEDYSNEKLSEHEQLSLEIMLEYIPIGLERLKSLPYYKHKNDFIDSFNCVKALLDKDELIKSLFIPEYAPELLRPLSMIINSRVDADTLDYLRRDSLASGVEFGESIDLQRIIRSIKIKKNFLCFSKKALSALENLVTARYYSYRYIHSHHTVIQTDLLMGRLIYNGIKGDIFSEEGENPPFSANEFGKIQSKDEDEEFSYKWIDDGFILQTVKESQKTNKHAEKAKQIHNKYKNRMIKKSLWKVSDDLPQLHKEIVNTKNEIIDNTERAIRRNLVDFIESKIDFENVKDEINAYENKMKFLKIKDLIENDDKDRITQEIKIEKLIAQFLDSKMDNTSISEDDLLVTSYVFSPYTLPGENNENRRNRILVLSNDELKDLLEISPTTRGLVENWKIENIHRNIRFYFSPKIFENCKEYLEQKGNLTKIYKHCEEEL